MRKTAFVTFIIVFVAALISVSCTQPAQPTLKTEPGAVPLGKEITVTGSGFTPQANIILIADTVLPLRGAVAAVMVQAKADSSGAFNEVIVIPLPPGPGIPPKYSPGSTYTVRAMDDRSVASATFTVAQ